MSIEIRHLVVNATVETADTANPLQTEHNFDPERFKGEIMAACREIIRQQIQQRQER